MRARNGWLTAALTGAVLLAGCGGGGSEGNDEGLVVVGTVSPIVELIRQVTGDRAEVASLVPAGRNTHDYAPRPSDARKLEDADLFIDNGLGLNRALTTFAVENLPTEAELVVLGPEVPQDQLIGAGDGVCHEGHCHGAVNAHLWPDPKIAERYVGLITAALTKVDPAGKSVYEANQTELIAQIGGLHEAIVAATATIPEPNRKLVVYHDAWAYFARRYGYKMVGALQAVNLAEPSAAEVRGMIEAIKTEGVPAFFGSEVFPSDVMDAVAEESGARHVPGLSDDTLPGRPGDPEHSYVGLMLRNAQLIVASLGGDTAALDAFAEDAEL